MENNNYLCIENQSALDNMDKELIEIVKANLKKRGVTQQQIADTLGVQRATIAQKFTPTIPLRTLGKFAEIAECSVADLLEDGSRAPQEITLTINGQEHIYQLKQ